MCHTLLYMEGLLTLNARPQRIHLTLLLSPVTWCNRISQVAVVNLQASFEKDLLPYYCQFYSRAWYLPRLGRPDQVCGTVTSSTHFSDARDSARSASEAYKGKSNQNSGIRIRAPLARPPHAIFAVFRCYTGCFCAFYASPGFPSRHKLAVTFCS
ncbi:hypothetical protein OH76DRAFT_335481 [Lentinus brumalis]|uniref:Uncharacterized protein n=1 Tax=Lentinus brumalis TaxID=2498619 RepID=A0A371CJT2_9APHY|nr:hypothetical protein OH76DRAFT_335481 [Polyporus brumalis]